MFVLELTYTAPLEAVDEALPAHVAWLDERYAAGEFLASGRKEPREGGVILAAGTDRAAMEELVRTDPFHRRGLCTYRLTTFHATRTIEALTAHQDPLPG